LSLSLLQNLLAQYAAKTDSKSPSQSLISQEETDEKKALIRSLDGFHTQHCKEDALPYLMPSPILTSPEPLLGSLGSRISASDRLTVPKSEPDTRLEIPSLMHIRDCTQLSIGESPKNPTWFHIDGQDEGRIERVSFVG
jgi:hypothetical protein